MKFDSLSFQKFGPFDRLSLDLSRGRHGLHVIYGSNEKGKTTALRGLGFLLFGFPHLTCDDYRYTRSTDQRVGATLVGSDGRESTCLRRRGKGLRNTLRGADDKTVLTEDELQSLLGGLSADQFDMLFGLSHARLVEGGKAITEGQSEVGAALFEAGAGMAGLRHLEKRLDERKDKLYTPRGKTKEVPVCLSGLENCRELLRAATLRIEAWKEQELAFGQAVAVKRQLEEERVSNRAETARLSAYRAALPTISALMELDGRLGPLRCAPVLRPEFADVYRSVVENLLPARGNRDASAKEEADLAAQLSNMKPPAAMLAEEAAIERMRDDLGARQKAESDRPSLFARMRENQRSARVVLEKNFGIDRIEDAEQLRLSDADIERIRRLGERRQTLLHAVAKPEARLTVLAGDIAEAERRAREAPTPRDVADLRTAYETWSKEGALEDRLAEEEERLSEHARRAEGELKRLAVYWPGSLDRVSALAVPLATTVLRYQEFLGGIDEQIRDRNRRLGEVEVKISSLTQQIQSLLRDGALPSEDDLRALRADRDEGLRIVRREWLEARPNEVARREFIERHAVGRHLLDAVEVSVQVCDEAADALRREAERATRLADCRAQLDGMVRQRTTLAGEHQILMLDLERVRAEWRDLWKLSGIDPRTPSEMNQFLNELASLRQRLDAQRAASAAVERLRERVDSGRRRLQEALRWTANGPALSLARMLESAKQDTEAAETASRTREQLDERVRELRDDHGRTEDELREARAELESWRREWASAVAAIHLTEQDEPLTASRYLDQITAIRHELGGARVLELRIAGIDRDREQFLASLNAVRARVAGSVDSLSTADSMQTDVDALFGRLNEARDLRTQSEVLEKQRHAAEVRRRGFEEEIRRLEARLEALRAEAGVADVAEIPAAIRRSEDRDRLEVRVDEERERLRVPAGGKPLDAFIAEALAARDGIDARLSELESRADPLDAEINQHVGVEVATRQKLEDWREARAEAAGHRQQAEYLLTRLRGHVADFAVLHLAREVLRHAVERYRRKNQGTLLDRAARFFRTLTDGAFIQLEVEEADDGPPILLAVRVEGEECVRIGGLSDGTRDQLFFALRLAAIEQRLQAREPMPLAVDDVLVNYDDRRSLATLRCLAELSDKTQILFFTHHQHLVDLARANLSTDQVFFHSLDVAIDPGKLG